MKTENFERAKAIETEIAELVYYKSPLATGRESRLILTVEGKKAISNKNFTWIKEDYSPNTCPNFLKEQLEDDLNFIADRILSKINKRIAELENEFESL